MTLLRRAYRGPLQRYYDRLVIFGCVVQVPDDDGGFVVCGREAEIAHCHSGSIVERLQEPKAKGKKLKRMDWLVLPLCPVHHRQPGMNNFALDHDVEAWEARYGTQVSYVDALIQRTGVNVWQLAVEGRK